MQYVQITFIGHIITKADMVICGIQNLMEDITPPLNANMLQYNKNILEKRIRWIVEQHNSMYT